MVKRKENAADDSYKSVQFPSKEKIACTGCEYRDKTTVTIDGEIIEVGVTKAFCDIYVSPNSKPLEVLFNGAECEFKV